MNKLLIGTACLGVCLISCSKETTSEQTTTYNTYNLVTAVDGKSDPQVAKGSYGITYDLGTSLATIATNSLQLGTSSNGKFQAGGITYNSYLTDLGQIIQFPVKLSPTLSTGSVDVTSIGGYVSNALAGAVYNTPGIISNSSPESVVVALSYNVGPDYKVRTFQKDICYIGATSTMYSDKDGKVQQYVNEDFTYRIVMDLDNKKATVVLYNAKFADKAPVLKGIVIEGLKLEFNNAGYTITGKDIVPKIWSDNTLLENPKFIFNNFRFDATGEPLVTGRSVFEVAGMYTGSFNGRCVILTK